MFEGFVKARQALGGILWGVLVLAL